MRLEPSGLIVLHMKGEKKKKKKKKKVYRIIYYLDNTYQSTNSKHIYTIYIEKHVRTRRR